jgi:hypothetical protein
VSSKDTRATKGKGRDDSSLFKKILNGTSRSAGGSSLSKPLKLCRSPIFNLAPRAPSTVEGTSGGSHRGRHNGRSSYSLTDTERPYLDDKLAVFERLKLQEQHDPPTLETEAWLQHQSALQKATLGVVPSISDDSFSLNTDSPLSDGISLERDTRGKLYYNLTSVGSSESSGDLEYEDVIQPSKPPIPRILLSLNFAHTDNATHLHELLVPEEVTDCSGCGLILDHIKYTCTTCGEKTPMSRTALAAATPGVGKGKSRASPDLRGNVTEYELQDLSYPPRAHPNPAALYTASNTNMPISSSNFKPLPALPSNSPTQTIFGKSFGSQSTLVPPSSSGSSSPTTRVGYELCAMCFEKVGLDHALPGGMDSPTLPSTPQELAIARRSAPKRKGELRHAFLFQTWGPNGWQDVGDCLSSCRPFSGELNMQRHEQNRTKCRIVAPGVDRYCQGIGINVPSATISRSASRVISAYPYFFVFTSFLT